MVMSIHFLLCNIFALALNIVTHFKNVIYDTGVRGGRRCAVVSDRARTHSDGLLCKGDGGNAGAGRV